MAPATPSVLTRAGLSPAEVEAHLLTGTATILDARTVSTITATGRIPSASHWPGVGRPTPGPGITIVYGSDDEGSRTAAAFVAAMGRDEIRYLAGGFTAWSEAEMPIAGLAPWHGASIPTATVETARAA